MHPHKAAELATTYDASWARLSHVVYSDVKAALKVPGLPWHVDFSRKILSTEISCNRPQFSSSPPGVAL